MREPAAKTEAGVANAGYYAAPPSTARGKPCRRLSLLPGLVWLTGDGVMDRLPFRLPRAGESVIGPTQFARDKLRLQRAFGSID